MIRRKKSTKSVTAFVRKVKQSVVQTDVVSFVMPIIQGAVMQKASV